MYVGRATELSQVMDRLDAQNGIALAVVGARGSGRSELLRRVADAVPALSATVAASPRESSWRRSGLSAVLSAIDRLQGSTLLETLHSLEQGGSEFEAAQALHTQILLRVTAPIVLLIDDADGMDEASQSILGYLARRVGGSPLRLVLSLQEMTANSPFDGLPVTTLGPIPTHALVEIGRSTVPVTVPRGVLDFVARASDGNPRAFLSILGALPAAVLKGEGPLPVPLRPGRPLREMLVPQLEELSEGALHILRVLAAASEVPVGVMEQLPGTTREALEELISVEVVHRVADSYLLPSSAMRMVAYWSTPAALRLQLHQELADACLEEHPGLHAWHRSHVTPEPQLVEALLAGARERIRAGATPAGVSFAERAISLAGGSEHGESLQRLVLTLVRGSEMTYARRYLKLLLAHSSARATTPMVGVLRVIVDFLEVQTVNADVLVGVLEEHGRSDPEGCVRLLCTVAVCRLERWEIDLARESIDRARILALSGDGDISLLDRIAELYSAALAGKPLPPMDELQLLADSSVGWLSRELSWILIARALSIGERYEDARRMLDIVADNSHGLAPVWKEHSLDVRYGLEVRAGRQREVGDILERIEADDTHRGIFPMSRSLRVAEVAVSRGDFEVARERIDVVDHRMAPGTSPLLQARMALVRARAAMVERSVETAIKWFQRVERSSRGFENPLLLQFHPDYVEALVELGRWADARRVHEELRRRSAEAPSLWSSRAVARTRALVLTGQESLDAFEAVLSSWEIDGDTVLRARTLRTYAERLGEWGEGQRSARLRREASVLLEQAAPSARPRVIRSGTLQPSTVLQPVPSSYSPALPSSPLPPTGYWTPLPPPAPLPPPLPAPLPPSAPLLPPVPQEGPIGQLTGKERAVVELVLKGHRNQAIAGELYVSVRTVELRLTTVYRKLAVRSRFELMRLLAERPMPT